MANKNFIVKNGLEVGGQEVVSSSGVVTSAALGGQTLSSTDSPTFNNLTLTNDIAVGGDLNLTGDLNITGDVNSLSVTDLDVTDQTITLGAGQVESASGGSGIVVDGSNASILWDETNDEWDFNKDINVTGTVTADGLTLLQNEYIQIGGAGEFQIFNDGSNTVLRSSDNFLIQRGTSPRTSIKVTNSSGEVELSYAGSPKLATTSLGIDVTGGIDVGGTDTLRYRMLNNGLFKGGIEVATTNGDMIGTSVVDDLAIRSQANILFSGGGNTEALRLNSTGGIISRSTGANYATGTIAGLFVDGTNRGTIRIRSEADGAAELFFDSNSAARWDISARDSEDDYDLHFYNQHSSPSLTQVGNPILTLKQTGNVAIGVAFTDPEARLHVRGGVPTSTPTDNNTIAIFDDTEGRVQIRGADVGSDGALVGLTTGVHNWAVHATATNSSNKFVIGYNNTSTDGNIFGRDNTSNDIVIDTSGRVGIGTINPDADFHIEQGVDNRVLITSNGPTLVFKESNTTNDNFGFYLNSSKFHLQTLDDSFGSAANIVTATQLGQIGIGTTITSPTNILHVEGTGADAGGQSGYNSVVARFRNTSDLHTGISIDGKTGYDGVLDFAENGVSQWDIRHDTSAGGNLDFRYNGGSGQNDQHFVITSSGDIGVGLNDPEKLFYTGSSAGRVIELGGDDCQIRMANQIIHADNSGVTTFHLRNNYGTTSASAELSLEAGRITLNAGTGMVETMRATSGRVEVKGSTRGRLVVQNATNPGDGDDDALSVLLNDANSWDSIFRESWIGNSSGWGTFWAGSANAAYRRDAADTNPNEYVFVGSGQKRYTFELNPGGALTSDGPITGNYYDYAEYFEWEDGNPDNEDRRGFTVVLIEDGLIRKATSDDDPEEIMGAISGTSGVVGDAAAYDWNGKYEIDEWGTRILDDVVTISWSEEDETGELINHAYKETEIPEGITVPENAERKEHKEYRLTANYDPEQTYVPRDKRPEWGIVGLLGKVRIRDESPKNPRWKYIKTINGKKLWLIR